MKSDCSSRLLRSKNSNKKESHSPTLASSLSQRSLWARSYKNQPFPLELKRRLIGHRFKFQDFSDEEEEESGMVVEEEELQVLEKKKKVLPHFKLISDHGQFFASRSRIRSERKYQAVSPRCKSVQSLKLPQVMEQKKEEDELQKLQRNKLYQFKDKNQFGLRKKLSDNNSHTDRSRDSLQPSPYSSVLPQRIPENQAQQTKSDKNKHDRSALVDELSKLIVDQIDEKKKKKEDSQSHISTIIEEQRFQDDTAGMNQLRIALGRLEQENEYLNISKTQDGQISKNNSQTNSEQGEDKKQGKARHQETINEHE